MLNSLKDLFCGSSQTKNSTPPSEPVVESVLNQWRTESIDGRRVDVFVPQSDTHPQTAVLFLHGHGRVLLNENPVFSRLFQQHGLVAVCPDGERSWWLDVVCSEFDADRSPQNWLMHFVLPFIEQKFSIVTPNIALLGVSMGGQGVLQLAFRFASRFPVVAAISPAVDFNQLYGSGIPLDSMFPDAEAARQASVVLNLHPLAWPRYQFFCCDPADTEWFEGAARL
ncbi:MAG: alpha/beta hydrolase-fold protein, partial [Planctomycetota bacterium]|nr:alpha/beta hydrolase-fold protein [Planctomycetota bacterium]